MSAMLIGTGVYIRKLLATGAARHFLKQFDKLHSGHWHFAAALCLPLRVPEALIHAYMKDDRIIGKVGLYKRIMHDALRSLENIPLYRLSGAPSGSLSWGAIWGAFRDAFGWVKQRWNGELGHSKLGWE